MPEIIQNHHFRIGLYTYSPIAKEYLTGFLSQLPPGFFVSNQTTTEAEWKLHLVVPEPYISILANASNSEGMNWGKLHRAWLHLEPGWTGNTLYALDSTESRPSKEYVHFIPNNQNPTIGRVVFGVHLHQIMKRWMMASGNILLHAAGIAYKGHGLLFLGCSGAGKSTVSKFSPEGARVLHDDTVFLCKEKSDYFIFNPPDLNGCNDGNSNGNASKEQASKEYYKVKLSNIYLLNQDLEEKLESISELNLAHALMASFLDLPRISLYKPSRREMYNAMIVLSQVARKTPAYELYFRNSPDFWKLIDEQFPN